MTTFSPLYPGADFVGVRGSMLPATRNVNLGAWTSLADGTILEVGDTVQYNGATYSVVTKHTKTAGMTVPLNNAFYTVYAAKGDKGDPGVVGQNTALLYIYQRSTTLPTKPSVNTTYTFADNTLTGLNNGWVRTIPADDGSPLYVSLASAASSSGTDTIEAGDWTAPQIMTQSGLNAATIYLYQRAVSQPPKPSTTSTYTFSTHDLINQNNGWQETIPAGSDPIWVTTATAASASNTDDIPTTEWATPVILAQNGGVGPSGYNTATLPMYRRSATTPTQPTVQVSYTFSTRAISADAGNGWTRTIPTGTDPLYVVYATASSNTDTDLIEANEWTSAQLLTANGVNNATIYLYQRKATAPTKPTANATYTFTSATLTGHDNGWSTTFPANDSLPLYITTATAANSGPTDVITPTEWSTPQIMAENGASGSNMIPSPVRLDKASFAYGAYLDTTTVVNGRPIVYKRAVLPNTANALIIYENGTQVMPVIPGETIYYAHTIGIDKNAANKPTTDYASAVVQFFSIDGGYLSEVEGASLTGTTINATTSGLLSASGSTIVPATAAYIRLYSVRRGVGQAGYFLAAEPFLGRSEQGATYGADWDANLDGVPDNLQGLDGTEGINNGLISIGTNGYLTGAGGGNVTLDGMTSVGFKADADKAIGFAKDVTDNNKFSSDEKKRYVQLVNGWSNTIPATITQLNNLGLTTEANNLSWAWRLDSATPPYVSNGTGFYNELVKQKYSDVTVSETIDRTTFNNRANAFANALNAAGNALDAKAATMANWASLSGTVPTNVANSSVQLGNNGYLTGGGGGNVLLGAGGLGYLGDLNATYGARLGINTYDNNGSTMLYANDLLNSRSAYSPTRSFLFTTASEGFTGTNVTLSVSNGILSVTATASDPILRTPSPINLIGRRHCIVRMRARATVAAPGWEGWLFYDTAGHSETGSFAKQIPEPAGWTAGEWIIAEWDMSTINDWMTSTITRVRFDLPIAQKNYEVDWISFGERAVDPVTSRGIADGATLGAAVGVNTYTSDGATLLTAADLQNNQLGTDYYQNGAGRVQIRLWRGSTVQSEVDIGVEAGATYGADVGSNIYSSGGALLTSNQLLNQAVAIGQNAISNSDFSKPDNREHGWVASWNGDVGNTIVRGNNLPGWFGALNVAFATASGNVAAGKIFDGFEHLPDTQGYVLGNLMRWALPVSDSERLFYSALVAQHRLANAQLILVYYNGQGALMDLATHYGASGGRNGGGADGLAENFDRIGGFAVVPAGARYCVMRIRGYTIAEANPYIFYTQMMLTKVHAEQNAWPAYTPGPGDRAANYVADVETWGRHRLQIAGSGVRVGDVRNMPAITGAGTRFKFNGSISYSAYWNGTSIVTINVGAGWLYIGSAQVYYGAMAVTFTGGAGQETYFLYVDDPTYGGGNLTLWATTSSTVPYQFDGRIFIGSVVINNATAAGGTGGTGGGGSGFCVSSDAWVQTKNGIVKGHEVKVGDELLVLTDNFVSTEWAEVEQSFTMPENGVRLTTESGYELECSLCTPITLADGSCIDAAESNGYEIPILKNNEVVWEKVSTKFIGMLSVQRISCGGRVYAAGTDAEKLIFTHNATNKP